MHGVEKITSLLVWVVKIICLEGNVIMESESLTVKGASKDIKRKRLACKILFQRKHEIPQRVMLWKIRSHCHFQSLEKTKGVAWFSSSTHSISEWIRSISILPVLYVQCTIFLTIIYCQLIIHGMCNCSWLRLNSSLKSLGKD